MWAVPGGAPPRSVPCAGARARWDGAGLLLCARCTQGYVEISPGAGPLRRRRHTACVHPTFRLEGPDGINTLRALQHGLDGGVAYIGEDDASLTVAGMRDLVNRFRIGEATPTKLFF